MLQAIFERQERATFELVDQHGYTSILSGATVSRHSPLPAGRPGPRRRRPALSGSRHP